MWVTCLVKLCGCETGALSEQPVSMTHWVLLAGRYMATGGYARQREDGTAPLRWLPRDTIPESCPVLSFWHHKCPHATARCILTEPWDLVRNNCSILEAASRKKRTVYLWLSAKNRRKKSFTFLLCVDLAPRTFSSTPLIHDYQKIGTTLRCWPLQLEVILC